MIVVYGSINIDIIGHAPSLMKPGETILGSTLEFAPGGKGANQALAAARAGADVKMVGCVGDDEFADRALELLREASTDLSLVKRMDRHTGVAMIVVDDAGENMITVLPGANSRLSASTLDQAGVAAHDIVLLQLEVPLDAIAAAATRATDAGAKVILNLAPYRDVPRALLDAVSVLVVNESEMAGLLKSLSAPDLPPEKAVAWLSETLDLAVVATLGSAGAIACEAGTITAVPALDITPVDTVGAGDTFVGYLAAGLAEGQTLAAALNLSATAAGLACLAPGAQPAIPERDAVDEKLPR